MALLALYYYNGHSLLTDYKTRWEAYISLNNKVNILEYFNLAIRVHSRPGIIGVTHYKKNTKIKVVCILSYGAD